MTKKKTKKSKKAKGPTEDELFAGREAELMDKLNKRFGKNAVRKASDVPDVFRLRRPTGIPSMDLELHGGFPAGGVSQIIGEDGIGKTDLCWRTLAQQQVILGERYRGAMFCIEMQPDFSQARFAGLKIPYTEEELHWLRMDYPEDVVEEMIASQEGQGQTVFPVGDNAEETLEIAVEYLRSGLFQVIVIDSIGAIQPSIMSDRDLDEGSVVAARANIITNFMGKVWSTYNKELDDGGYNETTILVLNQYREAVNMNNPKARTLRISGGRALKHGKLTDLFLKRTSWIREGEKRLIIGKSVAGEILKGKAGIHEGAVANWDFRHSIGVDVGASLINIGMMNEQIQKAGAWYSVDGKQLGQGAHNAGKGVLTYSSAIMDAAYVRRGIGSFRIR